ncbi:phage tail protein [Salinigranum halophilum]|jgi:phage tail-like protein|uniref:phage tail protein n=1 Tax=Salinigranum halophilum TaxID=2565931 RepID=UPI0010A89FE7|nr:phage tail protein [Salinigranum halophilum]
MSAGDGARPYLNFRFVVEVDSLVAGGFTEVSGLEREVETEAYDEGGVNDHTHTLRSGVTSPNLVLRRGLTDADTLWNWLQRVADGDVERKTVLVFLQDATGEAARGWAFREAYPVRWAGPAFAAESGDVAIETLELTHTGVSTVDGV